MSTIYLSLGSNLGDRAANLRGALARLQEGGRVRIIRDSHIYETVPVGETPEPVPLYLNLCARAETSLSPLALLEWMQSIERAVGRTPTYRWGPRVIDIDLLLYEGVALDSERLTLPHPRMAERAFVLVPLAELEPNLTLPDGRALVDLLRDPAVQAQGIRVWTERDVALSLMQIDFFINQYTKGVPSLGRSLDLLISRWKANARDEDTCIRLLFHLWYAYVEPPQLTGLYARDDWPTFDKIYEDYLDFCQQRFLFIKNVASPIFLWCVGTMADMFPWACGDERKWTERAGQLLDEARQQKPQLTPDDLAGFGYVGRYFTHLLQL